MLPTREEWMKALTERHGEGLQESFSSATVAVCGLGGLGSNIAIHLARAGIGKLILCDFDRVDITNLHRQQYKASQVGIYKTDALAYNLREINPYIKLETHIERITEKNAQNLLQGADIICEAFDDAEVKAMLADTVLSELPGKYLVAASGMAGMGTANSIRTRRITGRFYLSGDETSDVAENMGLVSARVALCAAHQAHTVLRVLNKQFEV